MARLWHQEASWEFLARRATYSCSGLADALGISLRHLERSFAAFYGWRLHDWIFHLRMRDAAQLLSPVKSIKEVAALLGYKQASHFTRDFSRHHKKTPREFVRSQGDRLHAACFEICFRESLQLPLNERKESKVGRAVPARRQTR